MTKEILRVIWEEASDITWGGGKDHCKTPVHLIGMWGSEWDHTCCLQFSWKETKLSEPSDRELKQSSYLHTQPEVGGQRSADNLLLKISFPDIHGRQKQEKEWPAQVISQWGRLRANMLPWISSLFLDVLLCNSATLPRKKWRSLFLALNLGWPETCLH